MNKLEKWHDLKGCNVLITGASGQLGTALAHGFREGGAKVFGFDLKPTREADVFDGFATGNVSKKSDVLAAFEQLAPSGGAFDILVNNAGITTSSPFVERTEEEFDKVYSVNVKGSFFCAQEFLKRYEQSELKDGAIVNIGSIYGVLAPDFRIYTDYGVVTPEVYGISKAGILQMTRYLAVLYANKGLRVNSVSPGGIFNRAKPQGNDFVKRYSNRVPMGRMAQVEEIVPAIVFLSGKGASYITGQSLLIDGGLSCW